MVFKALEEGEIAKGHCGMKEAPSQRTWEFRICEEEEQAKDPKKEEPVSTKKK